MDFEVKEKIYISPLLIAYKIEDVILVSDDPCVDDGYSGSIKV